MERFQGYGESPFQVCLVHGGPGAAGEMAPVATELYQRGRAVIEPFQTATTIRSQVEELKSIIENSAALPLVLGGFSWGAWLSLIFTARYPKLVAKLILISSGPLEQKYAAGILETRLARLDPAQADELKNGLEKPGGIIHPDFYRRFFRLIIEADSFEPVRDIPESDFNPVIYGKIWPEAQRLRSSGELLELAAGIRCPVFAIHGSYDPHPVKGVIEPLARTIKDFKYVILTNCGHYPWLEVKARDRFFQVLEKEIIEGLV
jgi:pimeloyl-ACP methyl ester carboxylesterase